MKSTARRVPRRVGQDQEEEETNHGSASESPSFVKRPTKSVRTSSKLKGSSNLRASYVSLDEAQDTEGSESIISKPLTPRRLPDHDVQRSSASQKFLPLRAGAFNDRPSYSAEHLAELKLHSSSTPFDVDAESKVSQSHPASQDVDIGAKFGNSALALATTQDSISSKIPSEAEIREKKERRRRLAIEQDYISLGDEPRVPVADGSDDEDPRSRSLIIPAEEVHISSKYGETRLVHEDEDIAEGFDEFVEDHGRVTLGRKAAKEQERQRRRQIDDQIRSAQHGYASFTGDKSSDQDDSEEEEDIARNVAYEAAQTRAGTYGANTSFKNGGGKDEELKRSLELPKLKVVPEFKEVVKRFYDMVKAKEQDIEVNRKRLMNLERERQEIDADETRVKELLKEAGDRYERLNQDAVRSPDKGLQNASESSLQGTTATGLLGASPPGANSNDYDSQLGLGALESLPDEGKTEDGSGPSGMAQMPTDEYSD